MKLAAIDIGSNSIHLVVARAAEGRRFEIIDREKDMVRLGAKTLREHRLAAATMDRAIDCLRRFKQVADANQADAIITTATAAVRESDNADEFMERAQKEAGLDVQLLPGVEEARLIALAVSEVTDFHGRRALIIDIGGGSTEFIITGGGEPELLLSARLGSVRLTEKLITTDPVSDQERERLIRNVRADLTRIVADIKKVGFDFVIGTSGTILNLVETAIQSEKGNSANRPQGFEPFSQTVSLNQIKRINRKLGKMTLRERGRVPGLEKARADIIVAGGLLLETILTELGAAEITTCDWSLREGLIINHLRELEAEKLRAASMPTGAALDVRERSVLSLAKRYDYDAPHAHHVAWLATRVFDDTQQLHGMNEQERALLQYAALLHDIGYHIAYNNHHRHSLYLIKNSEMPGFTANEIAVMATAVRYHRGSMPKNPGDTRVRLEHADFFALDKKHRKIALRLASILQIADGLDRSQRQLVKGARCEVRDNEAVFYVTGVNDYELETWSAARKSRRFSELMNVAVKFERDP